VLGPRRIAFVNEKGGSAKTTLVANLGAYLALRRGRRVLGIDMDPQGQLGKILGVDVHRSSRTAIDLLLDTLLGDPSLDRPRAGAGNETPPATTLPMWEGAEDEDPTGRLERVLEQASELDAYDFVLFDAPPSFGPLTLGVLRAAREIVVPVPLTFLALDGCAELMRSVDTVRTRYGNPALKVSMVVPTFYRRTKLAHELLERLKRRFPKEIAHTMVGYHVRIDEAQSRGLSIFEYAPKDRGAQVMAELAEELELRGSTPEGGTVA
jgi:chromosome partitioning protein